MLTGLLIHQLTPFQKKSDLLKLFFRDNCNETWIKLRIFLKKKKINLLTEDKIGSKKVDFEIHLNVQKKINHPLSFVIILENSLIYPNNNNPKLLQRYKKIFSWDDSHLGFDQSVKIQIPHNLYKSRRINLNLERLNKVVMIAFNKSSPNFFQKNNLYKERTKTIRWFENHAPNYFDLYGVGWNKSARVSGRPGYLLHKLEDLLPVNFFSSPSYKGTIKNKSEILSKYQFSIVYENTDLYKGYITEKIFDCFCAGCIPVYWGAKDILDYIPKNCFIDRRNFNSNHELYNFLKKIKKKNYLKYRNNIKKFLKSKNVKIFSIDYFIQKIFKNIKNDLNLLM